MIRFKAVDSSGSYINSALSPFTFPAGEAHTKREDRRQVEPIEVAVIHPTPTSIHDDLFQLAMWNNYVRRTSRFTKRIALIPYFPGARADRGVPAGLQIYADFVDELDLDEVVVFDPHSEALLDYLDWTGVVEPHDIILGSSLPSYDGIVAPDKGAVGRAGAVADALGLPLYKAEKVRDFDNGKLKGYSLDSTGLADGSRLLVVDDICDAGGTFMLLADAAEQAAQHVTLDLYVSHGVFSKQATEILPTRYRHIYTTNSYDPERRLDEHNFTRLNVVGPMLACALTSGDEEDEGTA